MAAVYSILKMNKFTRTMKVIVECIWFAATVMCTLIAVKELLRHNISQGLMFIALGLAALFFFLLRRNQRKNLEKKND